MDRRKMYLDEGDMMAAISDYVNKKSFRRLIPDWATLDLPFKALQFECFMLPESHDFDLPEDMIRKMDEMTKEMTGDNR